MAQYDQPKEAAPAPQATSPTMASTGNPVVSPAAGPQAGEAGGEVQWTVPAGWREDPTPHQMREATLLVGEGDKSAELIISRLGSNFGDFSANLNRWRGQVGLEPAKEGDEIPTQSVHTPIGDARVLELEGPQKKTTVAIVQRGESTWFFKLTGEKQTVTANRPQFDQLLHSLKAR